MTLHRVPNPRGGDPIEVIIADDVTQPPAFGWRAPVVEWPHPDGTTVTLAIDYANAVVYVEHPGDVQYGDAWADHHLAVGAPARARTGRPAAAWRTIVNPTRFTDIVRERS